MPTLLVVAASARALAESALRASGRPSIVAVDLFGDRDLQAIADWRPAADAGGGRPTLRGLLAAAARLCAAGGIDALLPGGGLEHHAARLARAAGRVPVLAAAPPVVAAVRDPGRLGAWAAAAGVPTPATWVAPDRPDAAAAGPFLRKPARSGGGARIRPWRPGEPVPRGTVVQRRLEGSPIGAAALGDGRSARLLALTRGLAGEEAFGARGFAYAGSLLGPIGATAAGSGGRSRLEHERLAAEAERVAAALVRAFGLRGLFGVDFLLGDGRLYLLEVNPRYTASMELVEAAWGASGPSLVDLHVAALAGRLPARLPRGWAPGDPVLGKAIVYARREARAPDTDPWLAAGWRDVPPAGARIPAGGPVCTVLAEAADAAACLDALARAAAAVRRALRPW